jgi:kinetochore protein Nuf2
LLLWLTQLCLSTRFAKAAKIDDFRASDLSHPDRERTIDLLSAFINFIKFTEQCCDEFVKDLGDKLAAKITERDQVSSALQETQEKIRGLQ